MAAETLTPTQFPKTGSGAPLNLTGLLATLSPSTAVTFANSGREVLFVLATTGGSTALVTIGTQIEGEPVTSITLNLTASATNVIGPFPADEDVQPGNLITVTFGTPANVTSVALLQFAGVN